MHRRHLYVGLALCRFRMICIVVLCVPGMRVILENPRKRQELLRYVTEELQGFDALLQYLGGSRYTSMCDRAENVLKNEDKVGGGPGPLCNERMRAHLSRIVLFLLVPSR